MFFRNLMVYRLTDMPEVFTSAGQPLEDALSSKPAKRCGSQDLATAGFCAPVGKGPDAPLFYASEGFLLLSFKTEEKILPGSVVRDALKEKVEEIETEQCRKVYKKERDQLKDDIVQAFLPRAFTRTSVVTAAVDTAAKLIYVNAGSTKKADDLLSTLREALGSLPVRPLAVKIAPSATLTQWLKDSKAAPGFHIMSDCELQDTHEDGGKIKAVNQDLGSEEMLSHLPAGMQVTSLDLAWDDKCSFSLNDKLVLRKLRFDDLLQDQASADAGDDAEGVMAASFLIMMKTLALMVPALVEALGGEEIPKGI